MNVLLFGGGVNSTAMLVGLVRKMEFPDLVIFADTGGEKPETYRHVKEVGEWLEFLRLRPIVTVRKDSIYASLESECLERACLPSIVYGFRSCSDKWKQEPVRKFMNNWEPAKREWAEGRKITKLVGFDAGESRRAKDFDDKKYQNRYPLIEWGWYREECIAAIRKAGLSVPVKSACFYCPASRKVEVLALKENHPELYARAVAMERNAAPNMNVIKGLGRHWNWEELPQIATETVEQICMCFDGE